jgi:serine/threonine-protein phosphatase 2A regulatory subunit B'
MKETLFLTEIGALLEAVNEEQFLAIAVPLFTKIGECIKADNFQVSEQGLMLWKSDRFVQLVSAYAEKIFPVICPYLYEAGTRHWNAAIKNLSVSVIRICMQNSPSAFNEFSNKMKSEAAKQSQRNQGKRNTWKLVANGVSDMDNYQEFAGLDALFGPT